LAAVGVHLFTASGAVWGLLALLAIADGRIKTALVWMAVTVAIDGADGALARLVRVREALPSVDGALLDNLVDYLNYVIVPAFLLVRTDRLPDGTELALAAAICLSSAFQFVHADAKDGGQFFRGFPSYWNVVAFYAVVLELPPRLAAWGVAALAVLALTPIRFLYPSRTVPFRALTVGLSILWSAALLAVLAAYPEPPRWLALASLTYVVYYVGMSVALRSSRSSSPPA
jgi:phosphatidylcholine synthase